MTQKDLRKWMRAHPGFVSFSVVRHPLHRLLRAYHGVQQGQSARSEEIRSVLSTRYNVPLAEGGCPSVPDLHGLCRVSEGASARADKPSRHGGLGDTGGAVAGGGPCRPAPAHHPRGGRGCRIGWPCRKCGGGQAPEYPGDPTHDALSQQVIGDSDLQKAVFDTYRKDYVQFGFAQTPSVSG
jgi:hypothetical protein